MTSEIIRFKPVARGACLPALNHILFIENDIDGYEQLIEAISDGSEAVILDSAGDGLVQIAALLAGRSNVATVHIVSHGSDGVVRLGTTKLSAANLGEHRAALEAIKAALAPGADLLLYGCNTGRGDAGAALLEGLRAITGANIAASTDATGAAALGGTWTLQARAGAVSAASLAPVDPDAFGGLLTAPADENFDGYFADTNVPAPTTLGGFSFVVAGSAATYITNGDTGPFNTVAIGTANVLKFNKDDLNGVTYFELHSADLADNFKLESLMIESASGSFADSFTVTGYDGGSGGAPIASDTVNLASADSAGSITYVKLGGANGGTLTFGAEWRNVDTVRFTIADARTSLQVYVDNLDISMPVSSPAITGATYDATTHVLTVTGTNLVATSGPDNDVMVSKLTLTGEGGSSHTLAGTDVELLGATSFAITLTGADRSAVELMLNKSGSASTGGTTYNLSAADDWNSTSFGNIADVINPVTVSGVPAPAIVSAAYDAATGALDVTGSGLVKASGAANDIVANKFTITGQGGAAHTLTDTPSVEINSGTSFTLVLSAADRAAVAALLDQNGAGASGGTTYNLAAASYWAAGSALGAADLAGNGITVTNITRPAVNAITLDDSALKAGDTATMTVVFSEAVSGLTAADITAANATIGAPATSDGGVTWTATLTPGAGVTDATNVLTVNAAGVVNAAWYAGIGSASSANYTIDTEPPTAVIAVADSTLVAGESSLVTITFSEAVSGCSNTGLTVANGTLSAVVTADGGLTWTATFTPGAEVADSSNLITLDNASVLDAAGNAGTGTTASNNYSIYTVRPTAAITVTDSALAIGETSGVTITFSEAVTGFSNAGVAAANGTLSAFATTDGGITWSAVFTPDATVTDATNVVVLDNTGVANLAGNAGSGTTTSNNYAIDTARPTAAITLSDTSLRAGETSLVTIVFTEAVTGLTTADLTAPNGTFGALASLDAGVTWTATLTPDAGITNSANIITLDNTGVLDAAGNAGAGTTDSINYAIDTARPTATVTVGSSALAAGASAAVTIRFSEAVSGFGVEDMNAGSGHLADLASADGGLTWTARLTADAGVQADGNTVRVQTTGVTDAAGNAGAMEAVSNSYSVGSRPPPPPPPPSVPTIDGVPATRTRSTDPLTGQVIETVVVPITSGSRVDDPSSPNPSLADIPLSIRGASGATLADLTVSLPTGTGMVADGPATLLSKSEALQDLIRRIEARTEAGSPDQAGLTGAGGSFLGRLDANAMLETRTLVLTASGSAPGQPIQITGAPGQGGPGVALVIDATGLPAGTVLHLNDVDFAAVIGAVTLAGGAGRNVVVGDSAAQNIYLGADDDELHGGDGDDVLAGGSGNDRVHGGSGNDTVIGGRSDTGHWRFFMDATGQLSARHQSAEFGPGNWENVAGGELVAGSPGLSFLNVPAARLQELALLYQAALGRVPDLPGMEFWAAQGATARAMMAMFMQQSEYASGSYAQLGDEAFVRAVYTRVLGRDADSPGLSYWTDLLDTAALARSDMLAGFALSDEYKARISGAEGLALGQGFVAQPSQWFRGSGDDILDGGPGSDLLVGGDGIDTVVYSGTQGQYRFVVGKDGNVRIVDGANGDIDTIKGIERGQFGDGVLDLGFTQAGPAALQTVGLLYQSLFDRPADMGGLTWWLGLHEDALQLARTLAGTDEFRTRYAGLEDAGFVRALFDNTGLQDEQAGGTAYWQDYLRSHTRAETLAAWIGNAEVIGVQFSGDGLWIV